MDFQRRYPSRVKRFILRFRGSTPEPRNDLTRIRRSPGIAVLDESSPRMVLVEGREDDIRQLIQSMPDWVAIEEQTYELPDPRANLKRPSPR
jgi:hypothetical protein